MKAEVIIGADGKTEFYVFWEFYVGVEEMQAHLERNGGHEEDFLIKALTENDAFVMREKDDSPVFSYAFCQKGQRDFVCRLFHTVYDSAAAKEEPTFVYRSLADKYLPVHLEPEAKNG